MNECQCACHNPGSEVMHAFPCCDSCSDCGEERIVRFDLHKASCSGSSEKRPKPKKSKKGKSK